MGRRGKEAGRKFSRNYRRADSRSILLMRTLLGSSASIESTMITTGIVQVANEIFQIPVDMHGPWSDTYIADSQSMLEIISTQNP